MQKFLFAFICSFLFLAACKEPTVPDMPPRKRACLHFINLHPDYQAIDVEIKAFETNGKLIDGLAYLDVWPKGGYASLLSLQDKDTGWVEFRIIDHATGAEIRPAETLRLYEEKAATLILTKGDTLIKTLDSFDADTDSTGNIRLMNFDESLTSVTMISSDSTVFTPNISSLNYTGYRAFKVGTKDIYFINNSVPDTIDVLLNKNIRLHRNYSAYIMKDPISGTRKVFWQEMARCEE